MLTGDLATKGMAVALAWTSVLKIVGTVLDHTMTPAVTSGIQHVLTSLWTLLPLPFVAMPFSSDASAAGGAAAAGTATSQGGGLIVGSICAAMAVIPRYPVAAVESRVSAGLSLLPTKVESAFAGLSTSIAGFVVYKLAYTVVRGVVGGLVSPDTGPMGRQTVAAAPLIIAGLLAYPWDTIRKRELLIAFAKEEDSA